MNIYTSPISLSVCVAVASLLAAGLNAENASTTSPAPASAAALAPPGGAMASLPVNNRLLNVDFAGNSKMGFAAIGQTVNDYWNPYVMPNLGLGTLPNIRWSDQSASPVDITVANAPGQWGNDRCVDPMYASFIYPWDSGHITVTITELPAGTYDFYVYAARASENGAPVIEFRRAGVSLWTKGTTLWGNGWYSTYWDEHEQYVRFRRIAVNNQAIVLDVYPDATGYASLSGLQIVPSSAIPSEQPVITRLLNMDFAGYGSPGKVGFGAVGLTTNDFWNADTSSGNQAVTLTNMKWSDQAVSPAGMTVWNGPGWWGNSLPDPMFRNYRYSWDGGNLLITLTNLPAGICDIYLYGHTLVPDDNAIFELWSDDVNWGTKGTSLIGYGPTNATWEVGQQYVMFKGVTVAAGKPVVIHAKHNVNGYNNVCGMQIAYTGAADTDADGLPDGWERRCFDNLSQTADADPDGDGLSNRGEYKRGTDPTRADSNANGVPDLNEEEQVWVEDAIPQGGYEMAANESWDWAGYWYDGNGWGGQAVYPHSGRSWEPLMHVSGNVPGGVHQHYFWSSIATMRPGPGEMLYAYANLDSTYPPSEIMLQWYAIENGYGSWEHRAYWGANVINFGQPGTASRHAMGAAPGAGQWVRLEVPASAVGLEGKVVEGMAFTLYGGRAAWDSAGILKADLDGDGLPDAWEMQYFGNLYQTADDDPDGDSFSNLEEYQRGTSPANPDTDGDGLYDGEEVEILRDASNPGLGYLDPLDPDTGGTGMLDSYKDCDHDGISNWGELRNYSSNPSNARTFNAYKVDSEYFHSAKGGEAGLTMVSFTIADLGGGLKGFTISGASPNAVYDLYFVNTLAAQRWQWRRVLCDIQCDSAGQAMFQIQQPDPVQGYFVILSAEDQDGDGLSDGYEAWFTYGSQRTMLDQADSDGDGLLDGWEVEYGLNPTSATGAEGANGNPDGDTYFDGSGNVPLINQLEHDWYWGGNYDPLKVYDTPANRPLVTVWADNSYPSCEQGTFTIYRDAGIAANYSSPLTVYYSVGGTLSHTSGQYSLSPAPPEWPRIYSATIPADAQSVTVTVSLIGHPVTSGAKTVVVKLTPYSVGRNPQESVPGNWGYVVDIQNKYDRATITFDPEWLRPTAYEQIVDTCKGVALPITLTGGDGCADPLTFAIVTGPAHGTLGPVTSDGPDRALVTYTPNSAYCGSDSFTFKVNDGARDSQPATVTINVGNPNPPIANCRDVMTGKGQPVTFIISGTESPANCNETLTFTVISAPLHGQLSGPTPTDGTHASVTYTPAANFEGTDGFDFIVSNCAYTSGSGHVTINVVPGPTLTAECRSDRIVLNWTVPPWVEQDVPIQDFEVYRCATTSGTCNPTTLYATVSDPGARTYADLNVTAGTTYCYLIRFRHQDACDGSVTYVSPFSNRVCSQVCSPPTNALDVAFIIDNTGSMGMEPLFQLTSGIDHVLGEIEAASGGNYRLALVTSDEDDVRVRLPFSQNNRAAFQSALALVIPGSGNGAPESTDECLNTVINALTAAGRTDPRGCGVSSPLQTGNFTPGFRSDVRKLVVMVTDQEPGGFCDLGDNGAQAAIYASQARSNCVRINAIQVGNIPEATPVMLNYYQTTCGWYEQILDDGTGIDDAVVRMLYVPGYCNCP